jgi:hypothetical protein
VFSALLTLSRISMLRVLPNEMLRESEPLNERASGISMELRVALP